MKRLFLFAVIITVSIHLPVFATIIYIPGQYSTIQEGIDASLNGDTVLVQPDTYYENINFNGHNILLCSMFLPTGDRNYISTTIIDADSSGTVVTFDNGEDSTVTITGFTIRNGGGEYASGIFCAYSSPNIISNDINQNWGYGISCYYYSCPVISDNTINGNSSIGIRCYEDCPATIVNNIISENSGGGIFCSSCSAAKISGNRIAGNSIVGCGGGVSASFAMPSITNNFIIGNYASDEGGGVWCHGSETLHNNIIVGNTAGNKGGGVYCYSGGPRMTNSIIWDNTAPEGSGIYIRDELPPITYCDIQDTLLPGIGNISEDPLFRDSENGDFHLMSTLCGDLYDSPCIDVGNPFIIDSLLDCSWGLGGNRSDMGAFGGGDSTMVGVPEHQLEMPTIYDLSQNYPNPFNPTTTINYQLSAKSYAELIIYNLLGQKVETLVYGHVDAGYHSVQWNASDYSSGIYFYKLTTGDKVFIRRMTFLK